MEDNKPKLTPTQFAEKVKKQYPQYQSMNDDDLVSKMIEKYPQYKEQIEFTQKKKDTVSVSTAGSSGSSKIKSPITQVADVVNSDFNQSSKKPKFTTKQTATKIPTANTKNFGQSLHGKLGNSPSLFQEYLQAKSLTTDEQTAIKQDLDDEINNKGLMNNITNLAKDWWNGVFSQEPALEIEKNPLAKNLQQVKKEYGNKITPQEATKMAYDMELQKRSASLSESKERSYLKSAQDSGKIESLKKEQLKVYDERSKEYNNAYLKDGALKNGLKEQGDSLVKLQKEISSLEMKSPLYAEKMQQFNTLRQQYNNTFNEYEKNNASLKNLGSQVSDFEHNLDMMKRDYGYWSNFTHNVANAFGDAGKGYVTAVLETPADAIIGALGENTPQAVKDIKQASQETRINYEANREYRSNKHAKPLQIDDIKSPQDFGSWGLNMLASQSYNLLAAGTGGTAGLVGIGVNSGGQKRADMVGEMERGEADYNLTQQVTVPILSGGAEMIGGLVDRFNLRSAGAIVKSATASERSLIAKGMASEFSKNYIKGTAAELSEETGVQIFQNVMDIAVLGKSDVNPLDGVKDAAAGAIFLTGAIQGTGGLASMGIKALRPFSYDNKITKLNEKIVKLESQLSNPEVDEATKTIVSEQIAKLKTNAEAVLKSKIEDVESLSNEQFQEILSLEKQQAELRNKAKEVKNSNLDPTAKEDVLKGLEEEFKTNDNRRVALLQRGAEIQLERIPQEDQVRLKQQAESELKTDTITEVSDNDIAKKALKLYIDEQKNKPKETTTEQEESAVTNNEEVTKPEYDAEADLEFIESLNEDEKQEVQTELENSPSIKDVIDAPTQFTYNGEVGNITIEGQQVVFETPTSVNELGNVNDISDAKLLEFGIEPVQELAIDVADDYSVTIDGKRFVNTNENPNDAITIGKNGEYSINLENDKGQSRTIRGQRAEQIAYNYKLKELENGTEQQIESAETSTRIEEETGSTTISETNGNTEQRPKKRRQKQQRSLKKAKEPLTKAQREEIELNQLIATEEKQKAEKQQKEEAELNELIAQEEEAELNRLIAEEERAKQDPIFEEYVSLRDKPKRTKKEETRFKKLNDALNTQNLLNQNTENNQPGSVLQISDKSEPYTVSNENGMVVFRDKKGKEPSATTKRKLQKEYVKSQDFTQGKLAEESDMEYEKNMNQVIANKSENPTQVAEAIININQTDYESDLDYKQAGIADHIGKVERSSFLRFGDKNYLNQSIAKQYIAKKGQGQQLDALAQEITEVIGVEVTEQDIVDFMVENSSGVSSFKNRQKSEDLQNLKLKFEQLTGLPATETVLNAIAESNNSKKEYENNLSSLDIYSIEELNDLYNERQERQISDDQLVQDNDQRKNSTSDGGGSGIQSESTKGSRGEKETAKSEPTGIDVATDEELQALVDEKTIYDSILTKLDQWEKELDDFGKGHLSMGIPLVIAKEAIKAMRLATKTSKAANEIVKAGYDYIIETDWYKNLTKKQQSKITLANFKNLVAESIRQITKAESEIQNLSQEITNLRDKLSNNKIEALEVSKMIKDFLKSNKITGKVTPTEINRLVMYANKISTAKDKLQAFDDFVNAFQKIDKKAQDRMIKLSDRQRVEKRIQRELKKGKTEKEIIDLFKEDSSARKIAEDYFERTKQRTDDEIRTKLNRMQLDYYANKFKRGSLSEKLNKAYVKTVQAFFDRAFTVKKAMNQAGMQYATSLYIATKGAPGYANYLYEKAHKEIFAGLTTEQNDNLNLIIRLRRIIALEKDGVKKGKDPMVHASNFNLQQAEQALMVLENDLGAAEFASLQERANKFYNQQQTLLTQLYENGIITEDFYNEMKDVEYIKTRYLDFLSDADAKSFNVSKGASTDSGIESLSNGWNGTVELNANELLAQSISTTTKALASNRLNLNLIKEYRKNKKKVETLSGKSDLTKAESELVDGFRNIEDKIITAESYSARAPIGYSKVTYFEDGEKKAFFMEDVLYKVYSDNIGSIWGSNVKDKVQTASGVNLVKAIATGQNPTFFITNTPRDFIWIVNTSMQYSNNVLIGGYQLTKDLIKASFKDIRLDSVKYQKAVEYGLMMDFLHLQGKLKFNVNPKTVVGKAMNFLGENKGSKAIKYLWQQGMTLGKYSEIGFRMAVFNRTTDNLLKDFNDKNQTTYKSVESIDENLYPGAKEKIYTTAVVEARESTVDFNQGGHLSKDLEAMIPYFNAATQGTRMLVEKVAENPVPTILRFTQTAGIVTGMGVGLSLWVLQGLKDDDEDVVDAYNRFYSGVSKFDRANYIVIPTGKDDKGEFEYTRIALPQALTPFFAVSRGFTHDAINKYYNKANAKSFTFDDTDFALQKNLIPIEFGVSENAAKVPVLKAAFSYVTGYDFFREQDISIKRGKVDVIAEGYESKSVEGFYKELGSEFGFSPARAKTATESLITTPSTNIGVGFAYGTMNLFFSKEQDDKTFGDFALKSFGGRVIKSTSDFNRKVSNTDKFKEKNAERDVYNARLEYQANTEVKRFYEGEVKKSEAVSSIKEIFGDDKRRIKNYVGRLDKNYSKFSSDAQEIKFAPADKKAALLYAQFGNNLFNTEALTPKQKSLRAELIKMKVLTTSTRQGYNMEVKNNK